MSDEPLQKIIEAAYSNITGWHEEEEEMDGEVFGEPMSFGSVDLSKLGVTDTSGWHPDAVEYFNACIPSAVCNLMTYQLFREEDIADNLAEYGPCVGFEKFGLYPIAEMGEAALTVAMDPLTSQLYTYEHDWSLDELKDQGLEATKENILKHGHPIESLRSAMVSCSEIELN